MTVVSGNTDDRYLTLQRLRDRLAEQLDVIESSRDVCALARRLQAVMKEHDDLPQSRPVSKAARSLRGGVSGANAALPSAACRACGRGAAAPSLSRFHWTCTQSGHCRVFNVQACRPRYALLTSPPGR
jgi:hypothetical protein